MSPFVRCGAILILGCAPFAWRAAFAQERDGGVPADASISPEAGTNAPAAVEEPMPMLAGSVVGQAPEKQPPARPADERLYTGQRRFGILLSDMHGVGLGLRLRSSRFAVDIAAGFRPVFATYVAGAGDTPEFRLLPSFELGITPALLVYRAGPKTELGFAAGYAYNSLLGHGATLAFYIDYDLGERFAAHFFLGPTIFPKAESRIRDEARFPAGGSVSSGIAAMQGIAGVSLGFFP